MLPIKKQSSALSQYKRDQNLERKKNLLTSEIVLSKASESDLLIANAGVKTSIRNLPQEELIKNVGITTKFICRDMGIKDWNNSEIMKYDATRFMQTLKKYYKDLTIAEVKMAFELAMVGELDEWLPKDKNGNPDNNHYQAFSVSFQCRILNAYKSKRGKVWTKLNNALPPVELQITQEQKDNNRKVFIQDIYDSFYNYKDKGIEPNFILSIFYKELCDQGCISKTEKPNSNILDKVYRGYVMEPVNNRVEKKKILSDYHKGNIASILMNRATIIQYNSDIKDYYDTLIESGKDIKQVVK